MTHEMQIEKLYECFVNLSDEQTIELWNTYHTVITCDMEKCFYANTKEMRDFVFGAFNDDDVLVAIFHNNHGFNLDCEYFRFFGNEPLIEGFSEKQAARLIRGVDCNSLIGIAHDLVDEQDSLGLPYVKEFIHDVRDIRRDVEKYLMSIDPMYLAELYCDYWNATHKGDMSYGGWDYFIRDMDSFDEDFGCDTPYEVATYILRSVPHFDPNHNYYKMYRNYLVTSNDILDLINFTDLVDHIVNELDPMSDTELEAILKESPNA